jgi:thiamine biosynthesis lipoprotein ApbE
VTAEASFEAIGVRAEVLVTDPSALATAVDVVETELRAIDVACSRFRDDSELARLRQANGEPQEISELLCEAIAVALRAAAATSGAVDPTVGGSLKALGWDRDFTLVRSGAGPAQIVLVPAAGWQRVRLDRAAGTVTLPAGVELDLGATAKAFAADRCAAAATAACGCGVLVNLGGDVAVAGPAPKRGWRILVTDDHRASRTAPGQTVSVTSGGLATSSTTVRRWSAGGVERHHILDPRTGLPVHETWRTVSVAAVDCAWANTASTAAIALGPAAPRWLEERSLPARLVAADGSVVTTGGWPA